MPHDLTREREPGFAAIEAQVVTGLREAGARLDQERHDLRKRVDALRDSERSRHESTLSAIRAAAEQAIQTANDGHDAAVLDLERRYGSRRSRLAEQAAEVRRQRESSIEDAVASSRAKYEQKVWLAESIFEEQEPQPRLRYEEARAKSVEALARAEQALAAITSYVASCRFRMPAVAPLTPAQGDPSAMLVSACERLEGYLGILRSQAMPKVFRSVVPVVIAVGVGVVAAGIGAAVGAATEQWPWMMGLAVGGAAGLVVAGVALLMLHRKAAQGWLPLLHEAQQAAALARVASAAWIEKAAAARTREEQENIATRDRAIAAAREQYAPRQQRLRDGLEESKRRMQDAEGDALSRYSDDRDRELREASFARAAQVAEAKTTREQQEAAELARHAQAEAATDRHEAESVESMTRAWQASRDRLQSQIDDLRAGSAILLRPWGEVAADTATAREFSAAAPFGELLIDAASIPGCQPHGRALEWRDGAPPHLRAAATIQPPGRASVLLESDAAGRTSAINALQATMLRLLVLAPPGKVRFTIIDPVGLGQGFAGFMHLADHVEALVNDRIWTEARHIEARLAELTEHMETVIQKYLRDEFDNIESYNAQANEIAEPIRYLVISDFPAGFTEVAVKRLHSIVDSGARCGVHVLMMRDVRGELPTGTDLELLHSKMVRVVRANGTWQLSDPVLGTLPLTLADPPTADESMAIVNRVGRAAKATSRVVVPFSKIAPTPGEVWSRSTERSVAVELGRTGATRLQSITLGQGTAQHALIAGRTGSGKSTLLHAIITNLALWYSPDEVELWLIDFKKGVEFKTYATHRLPHARAVAVETDREFGLSVLQGLDAEMRRRGELYRECGAQDVAGFRKARPGVALPRVLLIVDEFQELFVEDDKVGQDAAMLLDRLVRQGRAFGMHVILGSQTLGGAYALPRTTMGQMGVRIALQCNEADASLILSDDNLAARSLSRPGEAIYNDAAGLLEGNSPFQVCWLEDEDRDRYLAIARDSFAARWPDRQSRMVVFEGNAPARWMPDALAFRVGEDAQRSAGRSRPGVRLWFGDAVSMKEPTNVLLRRQSGANVVVVGQRDDAALGLSTAVLGSGALAETAQQGALTVHVIDGIAPDEPDAGRLAALHEALGLRGSVEPPRGAESTLASLAAEVARRTSEGLADEPPQLLLIHGVQRVRALRRNEDDFSYGGEDKPPTPDKLLAIVLRDGPLVGIHTVMWADTVSNLQRVVDRSGLRELDWRVCFQMSNADSSTIIDSPAASRIGQHRALVASEEHGTIEKFRPFAAIDDPTSHG